MLLSVLVKVFPRIPQLIPLPRLIFFSKETDRVWGHFMAYTRMDLPVVQNGPRGGEVVNGCFFSPGKVAPWGSASRGVVPSAVLADTAGGHPGTEWGCGPGADIKNVHVLHGSAVLMLLSLLEGCNDKMLPTLMVDTAGGPASADPLVERGQPGWWPGNVMPAVPINGPLQPDCLHWQSRWVAFLHCHPV